MKPDIHPEYRPVVFKDQSSGDNIIVGSTMQTKETITVDGVEYPLAKVELSSRSHPFFTGQMKIVDTAGRVERFERRYGARKKKGGAAAAPAEAAAPAAPAEEVAPAAAADAAPAAEAAPEADQS
jgi:large subunit ribosomal protein L31